MFTFGISKKNQISKNITTQSALFPGKAFLVMRQTNPERKKSNRIFEFSPKARTELKLNFDPKGEGQYTNTHVSFAQSSLETGKIFLFVNNADIKNPAGQVITTERMTVGRTTDTFSCKGLYEQLLQQHNLNPRVDHYFELVLSPQQEIQANLYELVLLPSTLEAKEEAQIPVVTEIIAAAAEESENISVSITGTKK